MNSIKELKNRSDYDEDKKNRIENIIMDLVEFIKWLPEKDIFMDYLEKKWDGFTDFAIAREYGMIRRRAVKKDQLEKLIHRRFSQLRKKFLEQYYNINLDFH